MALDHARVRKYLTEFDFHGLFTQELGWDHHRGNLQVTVEGRDYTLPAIAQKRGMVAYQCPTDDAEGIPSHATRRKIERQVARSVHEHIVVFTDADQEVQVWQWVKREAGRPAACREHPYHISQPGDALIQKLAAIEFTLEEEEGLTIVDVAGRTRAAFDVDRVTRRFYDRFKTEHAAFLKFIKGIPSKADREWYASLMLNRLMFVYFIQKKGFLDGNRDYLRDRLSKVQARKGKGKFLTFYRYFLLALFHEGLDRRPEDRELDENLIELLGDVPYLDGGLFEVHELERQNPEIAIPDNTFERLFDFFDAYQWHLDERPLRKDDEINPDVLGYIFEKYINQKQMGAYYTKEDITDYIAKNTIVPFLFDAAEKKCAIAFRPDSALWQLLKEDPDRYIYAAVRHGVIGKDGQVIPLPKRIAAGLNDVSKRGGWNRAADAAYALPTETWREHVARRRRCLELREKLASGNVHAINDLITLNLDIRQFAQDAIENCEGPELLRAFLRAISTVSVLDPTCGSGAFLFAALNILEPLYEACLDRMEGFLQELPSPSGRGVGGEGHKLPSPSGRGAGGEGTPARKPSPKKYSDFRKTLAQVDGHPNQRYFVLKSIIIGNLYGVDIMEEAVEICKLRLFLKLVAQVDTVDQIEPLPDIDFNIRAGNTLVGYTSLDQVRDSVKSELGLIDEQDEKALARIEEDAEIAARAYRQFREMQSDRDMDASQFHDAKLRLRRHLDALSDQLDRFLCLDYSIDADAAPKEFQTWQSSHHPFHWLTEYFGKMAENGFGIIIGNPPYVEYKNVPEYSVRGYDTLPCRDLYAFVVERTYSLLRPLGRLGLIVPISVFGTDGFATLQQLTLSNLDPFWVSSYANRPAQLFAGAQKRLTILCGMRASSHRPTIFTSRYLRWKKEERDALFATRLLYAEAPQRFTVFPASLEKLASDLEVDAFSKLVSANSRLANSITASSDHVMYYTRKFGYFLQFLDVIPRMKEIRTGKKRLPSELKELRFRSDTSLNCCIAALTSSTFFWFWNVLSDCRNLNRRDLLAFPLAPDELTSSIAKSLSRCGKQYLAKLNDTSQFMTKSGLQIETFDYASCKSDIDRIDAILADHFGLSEEEVDFVVNYDIKYRVGLEPEE